MPEKPGSVRRLGLRWLICFRNIKALCSRDGGILPFPLSADICYPALDYGVLDPMAIIDGTR